MSGRRDELLAFIATVQRPEHAIDTLADDEHLFESGRLDSLAVVQIVMFLEQSHGLDLVAAGVDPGQLITVANILGILERHAS